MAEMRTKPRRQTRHHGANRQIQLFRDVAITEFIKIKQNQRRAEAFRQVIERILKPRRFNLGEVVRHLNRDFADLVQRNAPAVVAFANPMQIDVSQDAVKPGLGPLRVSQLAKLGVRLAKRLLGEVAGLVGRTAEPVGVPIQGGVMVLDQPL
jgi:hypothetical protein